MLLAQTRLGGYFLQHSQLIGACTQRKWLPFYSSYYLSTLSIAPQGEVGSTLVSWDGASHLARSSWFSVKWLATEPLCLLLPYRAWGIVSLNFSCGPWSSKFRASALCKQRDSHRAISPASRVSFLKPPVVGNWCTHDLAMNY